MRLEKWVDIRPQQQFRKARGLRRYIAVKTWP
jgi:hypothetical protein